LSTGAVDSFRIGLPTAAKPRIYGQRSYFGGCLHRSSPFCFMVVIAVAGGDRGHVTCIIAIIHGSMPWRTTLLQCPSPNCCRGAQEPSNTGLFHVEYLKCTKPTCTAFWRRKSFRFRPSHTTERRYCTTRLRVMASL